MPKSMTAQNLTVETLTVQVDEAGSITGLTALVNVSYGETSIREQFDMWAEMAEGQRATIQGVYDEMAQRIRTTYLE